jgi:hypothetical protein
MSSQSNLTSNKTDKNHDLFGGICWHPRSETLFAIFSYFLVVMGLYIAFKVITVDRVAANFLTFGPLTLVGFGISIPVLYTVLVRHKALFELGLTTRRLVPSLVLGFILAWDSYRNTVAGLELPPARTLTPLIAMTLAVGLFEAVFFRGWLQLRFEDAFGLVPGLILAAACYSLYHIGYGMEAQEMLFLFGLGLMFGAFFRLTKNIFVLWPFYTPIGSLYTNLTEGLSLPFDATYGFLLTMGLMIAVMVIGHWLFDRGQRSGNDK